MPITLHLETQIGQRLIARNQVFKDFFTREAERLAGASRDMAERFLRGGRLLAFGRGPYATDAQHVSVEFVHPVIVGKRALPALDLSFSYRPWLEAIVSSNDIVMGFGPPTGDLEVLSALKFAGGKEAMTCGLPGVHHSYSFVAPTSDPFMHQELMEILYHTLWETVHVFLEHRELGHDVGESAFLYPFLGEKNSPDTEVLAEVSNSIQLKVDDDARLRERVAQEESENIRTAILAIFDRVRAGGKLILLGNGGSATDANDFAIDCFDPPLGYAPIPAVSLSLEPANVTAIANDVGTDVIFLRQLIAQSRPGDVVVAFSTSGGSRNIAAALEEAQKQKLLTVALLGYDGGEIHRRGLADVSLIVRSDYIPRIQEVHASIYHVMREGLETLRHGSL